MTFIIVTQNNNGVSVPITNDSRIGYAYRDINESLSSTQPEMKKTTDVFSNVTPTQQYGELEVTSVVSPTKIARTIILGLWYIYVRIPTLVLGVSPVVGGLITSILLLLLIIGIWAIWKGVIQ
jgi:hypothetical protein